MDQVEESSSQVGVSNVYQVFKFKRILNTKEERWPHPRSGHRAIASNNKLWILGGYNPKNLENIEYPLFREAWVFDIWMHKWKKLTDDPLMPHTLASQAVIRHSDYMIAMGGTGFPFGLDKSSNDISVCNLTTEKWRQIETKGDKPEKVYGQAMALQGNCLYVYGGTSGFEYTSDLHCLRMDTMTWRMIEPINEPDDFPPKRYRHEMVLYDDELYVIGGGTSVIAYNLETVWIYNIEKNLWRYEYTKPDRIYPEDNGYPSNRRCHSCVLYKDSAYVCGGYDSEKICADLWQLHLPTLQWRYCSRMKHPLYFHSAAVTSEGCMYVFGGVSANERRNNTLHRVWLDLPSLTTLCVNTLVRRNPTLLHMSQHQLVKSGITPILSNFINGTCGG